VIDAGDANPNLILILTDDQGYGDLACHGNPVIRTPSLDRLHAEGVCFRHFHASPVCSPTRASLMTGRYNFRTGAIDTYLGRSMMHPDEVTLPELLGAHGYRTGIFGKWHLGDNYPMRAMDKGFQEALVHNGGGLAQPSGRPGDGYFDPVLSHNGVWAKHSGYCTDIFTSAAIAFIARHRAEPFFVYLATNAPHMPLQVADEYSGRYLAMGLDEETAKTYAMITNIDDNVGRLLASLKELGLERNTIVIFLTDNGPAVSRGVDRFNAGLRDLKGSVYDGGIRVPCFLRWPARLQAGREIDEMAAHIDLLPTLLDACGAPLPDGLRLDGISLLPLLLGAAAPWPERTLYFQWHRGDEPEPYRNCCARSDRYKLVNGTELYDLIADPGEQRDIAADHPEIVARMRAGYEAWIEDVSATRGYAPPRIHLGTLHENPVTLTRQDWRGAEGWGNEHLGYWEVKVATAGEYDITLRFSARLPAREAHFRLGDNSLSQALDEGATACVFQRVPLPAGDARLEAWLEADGRRRGVSYVDLKR